MDEVPLSRPKRNIARDFSDGVLVAELVAHYFPSMVELHNYSSANSAQQKGAHAHAYARDLCSPLPRSPRPRSRPVLAPATLTTPTLATFRRPALPLPRSPPVPRPPCHALDAQDITGPHLTPRSFGSWASMWTRATCRTSAHRSRVPSSELCSTCAPSWRRTSQGAAAVEQFLRAARARRRGPGAPARARRRGGRARLLHLRILRPLGACSSRSTRSS